ncbi:uncharacterized protein LOC120502637 [Passer montanus]|uniref:uncharacterized protein LOC120502637 n=1 Tax=Passer montanus TaxID=9160 RepID=UPI00195F862C|nr:uncharacterized protein LOC120502637 [Passer montanus]
MRASLGGCRNRISSPPRLLAVPVPLQWISSWCSPKVMNQRPSVASVLTQGVGNTSGAEVSSSLGHGASWEGWLWSWWDHLEAPPESSGHRGILSRLFQQSSGHSGIIWKLLQQSSGHGGIIWKLFQQSSGHGGILWKLFQQSSGHSGILWNLFQQSSGHTGILWKLFQQSSGHGGISGHTGILWKPFQQRRGWEEALPASRGCSRSCPGAHRQGGGRSGCPCVAVRVSQRGRSSGPGLPFVVVEVFFWGSGLAVFPRGGGCGSVLGSWTRRGPRLGPNFRACCSGDLFRNQKFTVWWAILVTLYIGLYRTYYKYIYIIHSVWRGAVPAGWTLLTPRAEM